ncbi:hypothetical protein HPB50_008412 [Hyalomma asiaticum]|uniref:Uncharacterized protein n=1 Tax=Hyalomma asiaticum TaxID=266040 RepID=A0ACB7RNX3_HYAAI|nr:hypothetical protein HPB50_008412 [Hyalomma asiaticum]
MLSQLSGKRWPPCLHTHGREQCAMLLLRRRSFSTGVVVAARRDSLITHAPTTAPVKQSQPKKKERKEGLGEKAGEDPPENQGCRRRQRRWTRLDVACAVAHELLDGASMPQPCTKPND